MAYTLTIEDLAQYQVPKSIRSTGFHPIRVGYSPNLIMLEGPGVFSALYRTLDKEEPLALVSYFGKESESEDIRAIASLGNLDLLKHRTSVAQPIQRQTSDIHRIFDLDRLLAHLNWELSEREKILQHDISVWLGNYATIQIIQQIDQFVKSSKGDYDQSAPFMYEQVPGALLMIFDSEPGRLHSDVGIRTRSGWIREHLLK